MCTLSLWKSLCVANWKAVGGLVQAKLFVAVRMNLCLGGGVQQPLAYVIIVYHFTDRVLGTGRGQWVVVDLQRNIEAALILPQRHGGCVARVAS
jgi:hypothetical protein